MNCTRCGKFKTNDSILCSDCQTPETRMHQMPDPQLPFTREYVAASAPADQASYHYPAWQTGMPPYPFAPGQTRQRKSHKIAVTISLIVLSLGLLAATVKAILYFNQTLANSSDPSNAGVSEGSSVSVEAKIPEPTPLVPATKPPEPEKPSEPASRTTVLKSSDGKIQITLPEGWQEDRTLNKKASLQAGDETKSIFIVVFTDYKKDYRPLTLEKYDEIGLKYFLKPEIPRQVTSHRKTTVNDYPALQSEVHGISGDRNLFYLHTSVETSGAYYEIVAWTRPSLYESSLPVIQEMIQSFRERPEK